MALLSELLLSLVHFDPPEMDTRLTVYSLAVIRGSCSKVWDTYTGDILHSFPHQHIVRAGDFSGDGSRIVTGGMEKKLRIFDLNREDMAGQALLTNEGHSSVIKNVVWDGPRNMILSSGEDTEIRYRPLLTSKMSAAREFIRLVTNQSCATVLL